MKRSPVPPTPDTLQQVSRLINNKANATFSGSWMLVAEWNNVPQSTGHPLIADMFCLHICRNLILLCFWRVTHEDVPMSLKLAQGLDP